MSHPFLFRRAGISRRPHVKNNRRAFLAAWVLFLIFFSCSGKFQNPILTFSVLKMCVSWFEHMCVWQGVVICVVYLCVCMECGLCVCIVSVVTVCVCSVYSMWVLCVMFVSMCIVGCRYVSACCGVCVCCMLGGTFVCICGVCVLGTLWALSIRKLMSCQGCFFENYLSYIFLIL